MTRMTDRVLYAATAFLTFSILLVLMSGCSLTPLQLQPANPRVVADIQRACLSTGLFKLGASIIGGLEPIAVLPLAVIEAGVDRVCADPTSFASDLSTAEWVVKTTLTSLQTR